jgi:hypothetical protein
MDHEYRYLSPYSVSEQLQPVIKDLELSAVTQQLKDEGFAIVRDAVAVHGSWGQSKSICAGSKFKRISRISSENWSYIAFSDDCFA